MKQKNKFVVYTALFGNYDDLIDPKEKYEGCDFICFTDQENLKSDIWEIRLIKDIDLPPNMMNRKYKILPHLFLNDYDASMYVDTNIAIIKNPKDLADKYLTQYDFVMPKHFSRNCIYDEAEECIRIGKVKENEASFQITNYQNNEYPKNFGLGENNILLRFHNKENVIKLMDDWWYELNMRTQRDQLSLGYVLWKNEQVFNYMDESARGGQYFRIKLHIAQEKTSVLGRFLNLKNNHIANYPNGIINNILKKINEKL